MSQFFQNSGGGSGGGSVPVGVVLPFAGTSAPDSTWLFCYGQAISRTDYADLWTALGTAFGAGNGTTTFNLPDLRGRVAAGKDDMGGAAASRITAAGSGITGTTLGAAGGAETHTLTSAQHASHNHTQDAHTHTQNAHNHGLAVNSSGVADAGTSGSAINNSDESGSRIWRTGSDGNHSTVIQNSTPTNQNATATNQAQGSGSAHQNTQPTLIMNYIIKALSA